jgi:hypothetical protein
MGHFDAAVLSHSANFFLAREYLRETFEALRGVTPRLFIADWYTVPFSPAQATHALVVELQALTFAATSSATINCRLGIGLTEALSVVHASGWEVSDWSIVESRGDLALSDGELDVVLGRAPIALPRTDHAPLARLRDAVARSNEQFGFEPLHSWLIAAESG